MKRKASNSGAPMPKRQRVQRQDATVTAVVRKELRKKTDWKYTDSAVAATGVSNGGQIISLCGNLTRGDLGYDQFEGNTIRPQAITLKYYFHTNQIFNTVRLMVFQWFDSSTPAVSGVLQSTGVSSLVTISPTLTTNKPLMKVLYDCTHAIAPTASDATFTNVAHGITQPVTVYIPGKRLRPVKFNSTTTARQDGDLFILVISDDVAPTHPVINLYSRLTFSDS